MRKVTDSRDGAVYVLMPGKEYLPPSNRTCALCFRDALKSPGDRTCGEFVRHLDFTCNSSQHDTFAIPVPDTPEGMAEFQRKVVLLNLEK